MLFQVWHEEFGEISPNHSKVWKVLFDGLFFPKYTRFELQKYRGIIFHDTEQWCKIWINPDVVVSKMAWGIGWTFIRALKRLKNCTLMAWKVEEKLTLGSKNDTWGIWWILMRAVASLKICTLMCYFCQKSLMF